MRRAHRPGLISLEREDEIDLVFSDILMPGGMNGLELADAVHRRLSQMAVLLTTGYSSSAQDAVRRGFECCRSPIDIETLERASHEAQEAGEVPPRQQAVG